MDLARHREAIDKVLALRQSCLSRFVPHERSSPIEGELRAYLSPFLCQGYDEARIVNRPDRVISKGAEQETPKQGLVRAHARIVASLVVEPDAHTRRIPSRRRAHGEQHKRSARNPYTSKPSHRVGEATPTPNRTQERFSSALLWTSVYRRMQRGRIGEVEFVHSGDRRLALMP